MPMNKSDIVNEINKLTAELPLVKKVAEISEHEGLEIAYNELTEKCCARVKVKSYKESKDAIKALEVINNFQTYLNEQKNRAERIECRIAELRIELTKCQLSLFQEENIQKIATGIQHDDRELYTGDVFKTSNRDYLLIIKSEQQPSNYVITGTAFDEELLLQYPKSRTILNDTAYIGNIFDSAELAEFLDKLQEKQEELQEQQENEEDGENEED